MAAGFQRHIAKPIEPQLLIQAIANVISSASAIVLEMMMHHRQEYLNTASQKCQRLWKIFLNRLVATECI
ncbi:hypothetical protein NIES37_68200 [Tolypothrix tenuis PCC 7101]|uniref:Uncharacterized protein n=1 Tax=Tolypothrix tenuis PCC 7101 TaxID=231146 RepID=A0A1Z4NAP4_9CYAN|nr:hypothetical protein [Aulosira sp. FACHB-113]BAZ02807.1 hypothetical protein NIES37_68200 [Tolypothrix tenuis PCC 7101]BAZ78299.1 hypothetical protein NIES50_69320 [Aulosira laxa NIES-50]